MGVDSVFVVLFSYTGAVDPMVRTVKVTEVTLITGALVRAADTAEVSLYRLCLNCKYLVT